VPIPPGVVLPPVALISLGCWLTLPFSRRRCAVTRPARRAAWRRERTGKFPMPTVSS